MFLRKADLRFGSFSNLGAIPDNVRFTHDEQTSPSGPSGRKSAVLNLCQPLPVSPSTDIMRPGAVDPACARSADSENCKCNVERQSTSVPRRGRQTTRRANHLGDLPTPLSSLFRENILIFRNRKSVHILGRPAPNRGAFRDRHGRGAGCGGRGECWRRERFPADGKIVWS